MRPFNFGLGGTMIALLGSISAATVEAGYAAVQPLNANVKLVFWERATPGTGGQMCGSYIPTDTFCDKYRVDCGENIGRRNFTIRKHEHQNPTGSVILTSGGGNGKSFYGDRNNRTRGTIDALHQKSLNTYEIRWNGGWDKDSWGRGMKGIMCAPAAAIQKIHDDYLPRAGTDAKPLCDHGQSGGAMQVGYALALYGAEDWLDFALLTGGPPTSDFSHMCFDGGPHTEPWSSKRGLMDMVMGWHPAGTGEEFCKLGLADPVAVAATDAHSIVSPIATEVRDFSHPGTTVSFVQGQMDKNLPRAMTYRDALETAGTTVLWKDLDRVDHGVHTNGIGAAEIRAQLIEHCKE